MARHCLTGWGRGRIGGGDGRIGPRGSATGSELRLVLALEANCPGRPHLGPVVCVDCHIATVIFAMFGKAFISFAYSVVYVYASEIYPTEVRNIGVGTAAMCGRVSSTVASYAGGPLVS